MDLGSAVMCGHDSLSLTLIVRFQPSEFMTAFGNCLVIYKLENRFLQQNIKMNVNKGFSKPTQLINFLI